jgi:hypothetical protein
VNLVLHIAGLTQTASGEGDFECDETPAIPDESVTLVVTSPPFLDIVDYQTDNLLRCWFNQIDPKPIKLWMFKRVDEWSQRLTIVFRELHRILKRDGFVAFEVGEGPQR